MSKFSELLLKLTDIQNTYTQNFQNDLQKALDLLDGYGGKNKRVTLTKGKNALTTLQSITEDEEKPSTPTTKPAPKSSKQSVVVDKPAPTRDEDKENLVTAPPKTRKRSRVAGDSPEPDSRRPKRNAGLVAQGLVSKQVNVNLNQKLRREESLSSGVRSTRNKKKDGEPQKEVLPPQPVKIKEEKLSIPSDPTELDAAGINLNVKEEAANDESAMPPPAVPLPKGRGRAKKVQTEDMPPPPMPAPRATRSSSRNNTSVQGGTIGVQSETEEVQETRPKRTRGRKKATENKTQQSLTDSDASPDKPRPKRTRRGKQNDTQTSPDENLNSATDTEKRTRNNKTKEQEIVLKKEKISQTIDRQNSNSSPILKSNETDNSMNKTKAQSKKGNKVTKDKETNNEHKKDEVENLDKTVMLNGVCEPSKMAVEARGEKAAMNETVILDRNSRETMLLHHQSTKPLDATVVLEKACPSDELTDDNSLMTDDSEHNNAPDNHPTRVTEQYHTPTKGIPQLQPTSAVKEKVQQFEELAQRTTRTKTRAMAKKEEQPENHTPPDKIMKPVLSAETLTKMNSLIFNGKPHAQISSSATKPRTNIVSNVRSFIPCSASKLTSLPAARETEDKLREDARKKKEALLEAKREAQRRKREEKTAAAAAARSAAERDRMATMEALTRALQEKQALIDIKEREKLLTLEKKKQELARKVAETDSRRRAEEVARQKRLADEQRKADLLRKQHIKEAEATKKEAEKMAKEMEKRQKEYIEKLKLKQKLEAEKLLTPKTPQATLPPMEPVYMADGFQYLNSDDDEDDVDKPKFPVPDWSTRKMRWPVLERQWHVRQSVVENLFSVRIHSPDLREMFPSIRPYKRTSSAVWRTPPSRLETVRE